MTENLFYTSTGIQQHRIRIHEYNKRNQSFVNLKVFWYAPRVLILAKFEIFHVYATECIH